MLYAGWATRASRPRTCASCSRRVIALLNTHTAPRDTVNGESIVYLVWKDVLHAPEFSWCDTQGSCVGP